MVPGWVTELGVAASVVISVAAIWGDRIRGTLLRPRLTLSMSNRHGALETILEDARFVAARYYRVRVTNRASHPEAREVEVLLTRLELRGPDGNPQRAREELLPLMWQHHQLYSPARTVGRTTVAEADLLIACEDRLQWALTLTPFNFPATMRGETHLWVTLVARGLNGESNPLRLRSIGTGSGTAVTARWQHTSSSRPIPRSRAHPAPSPRSCPRSVPDAQDHRIIGSW